MPGLTSTCRTCEYGFTDSRTMTFSRRPIRCFFRETSLLTDVSNYQPENNRKVHASTKAKNLAAERKLIYCIHDNLLTADCLRLRI